MATLSTQNVTRAGVVPALGAITAGGDKFTPGSSTFLYVNNGGGSSTTVTVAATKVPLPNMVYGNVVVTIANGTAQFFGPFPSDVFTQNDGTGLATIAYSGNTASVTIAVINVQLP